MHPAFQKRRSGLLMPVFSIPNDLGSGDFGPGAIRWLEWLKRAGQRYWMILPLNPVDSTGSPYASSSTHAYNELFISPEYLVRDGWLKPAQLADLRRTNGRRARGQVRLRLYRQAHQAWCLTASAADRRAYRHFVHHEAGWLDAYSLFAALKDRAGQQPWWTWPEKWRTYHRALRHIDGRIGERQEFYRWMQWQADTQWSAIRRVAKQKNISIIGDMPFVVRTDSVDVWANPELFLIRHGKIAAVGGMPPDPFTRDGQRWGTPVFHWPAHRQTKYAWWSGRLGNALRRMDLIRLDHFQGFIREWVIPARAQTARGGHWVASPGDELLHRLKKRHGAFPVIVEDLGLPLPDAESLRQRYQLPGTRIFEFGWSGLRRNPHAIHHIAHLTMFMTSNHDLPPVAEWWTHGIQRYERQHLQPHLHGHPVHRVAIELVWQSPAAMAITTLADVRGDHAAARINRPGTRRGNWEWQARSAALSAAHAAYLRRVTRASGRGR